MKRKVLCCGLSLLLVATLVLVSCTPAVVEEEEQEEEMVPEEEEEEMVPAVGEQEEEEEPEITEPEPEPTPPTSEIGYSRGNPAAVSTELYIEDEFLGSVSELNITLLEVIRGEEAWRRIEEANMFNDPAPPGFEHILVKIRVEYLKGPTPDTTYDISPVWFDVISSEGKELECTSEVPPDPNLRGSIYPGATHEGWAVFQVEEQDNKPLLTFGRDYKGSGGIWWQLY